MLSATVARLVAASERPDLQYRVTILNSGVVNAFALPSGDLFVTRGLLALANDTSEVAAVMAHEIAHVTARHALLRAEQEKKRVALTLRERAATVVDQYANARLMAVEYRDEMLPRVKKAYGLMVEKYGLSLASYPRVLETQKKMYEMQLEYIMALEGVWTNGVALQGYLLTDGLEAPARPGEMDLPVRETNVPMPERMMSPGEAPPRP